MKLALRPVLPCLCLLLLLPALGPRAIAEEEEAAPGVTAEFQERIDAAIERGVAWLRTQQRRDGSYPGFSESLDPNTYNPMDVGLNALVVQTLAHCGVKRDDHAIRKALDFCRFHYSGGKGSWNLKSNGQVMVYTAATLVLAFDALYGEHGARGRLRRDRYGNPIPPRPRPCKMSSADRNWVRELVEFLVGAQMKPSGGWRYPGNPVGSEAGETDLSNTQYALLALDAAARCAIEAPKDTWLLAAEHVLREQEEEGLEVPIWIENEAWEEGNEEVSRFLEIAQTEARGWCYLPGQPTLSTGSMSAAGVTCLAMIKERLWAMKALPDDLSRRLDGGMLDGLAWLSDHFTVTDNPDPPNQWHYYYLYGLERVGAKTGVRWIGQHDWYVEGAAHLLAAQEDGGGWAEAGAGGKPADATESAVTQTCFALLFLKRATRKPLIPVAPPTITGDGAPPVDNR